jgi:MerR family copper efflux transcriptional regulator
MSTAGPGESPDLLTIGELARWANVTNATLRHYEALGLLDPAAPPPSEPGRYPASAAGLVEVIVLLHEVGFTPRETREMLDARAGSPRSWRQLTERKIAVLDRQIDAARLARAALDHALGCEHERIVDCQQFRELATARRPHGHEMDDDLHEPEPVREPIEPPAP